MAVRRTLVFLVVIALGRVARAQAPHPQGGLALSGGWTDNIASTPQIPPPGLRPPESDSFMTIAPSLSLSLASDKAIHRITYTFTRFQYFSHTEANSNAHQGDWQGLYQPTSTSDLVLGASLVYGQLNTFNMLAPASLTMIGATLPGGVTFFSSHLREALIWDLNRQWRATQAAELTAFIPVSGGDLPKTFDFLPRFQIDRIWHRDAFGGEIGVGYTHYTSVDNAMGMEVSPLRQQLLLSMVSKWKHDYSPTWSTEIDGGVVMAARANDFGARVIQPTGLLAARYTQERIAGELSYTHLIQANSIIATTFIIDTADLRISVPIGRRDNGISVSGSAGVQYGRQLDLLTGNIVGSTKVFLTDAAIGWAPKPEFEISARYQYFDQIGDPMDLRPLPSISRNAVLISLSGHYPAEIPTPPPRTNRADERDETFLWGRPASPRPGNERGGQGGLNR